MKLTDFLKSFEDSDNLNHSDIISMIANDGLFQIQAKHKTLTNEGKFEVFIFYLLIILNTYSKNHPNKYEYALREIFSMIYYKAQNCNIPFDQVELLHFVNSRFKFYQQELNTLSGRQGYIPGKLFSAFYMTPLIAEPEQSFDISEVIPFYIVLAPLIKWIQEMSSQI